jgi:hypothetical protein
MSALLLPIHSKDLESRRDRSGSTVVPVFASLWELKVL